MKGSGTNALVALSTAVHRHLFRRAAGAFTGYFGGLLDEVLMRIIDVVFAFPASFWRWYSSAFWGRERAT